MIRNIHDYNKHNDNTNRSKQTTHSTNIIRSETKIRKSNKIHIKQTNYKPIQNHNDAMQTNTLTTKPIGTHNISKTRNYTHNTRKPTLKTQTQQYTRANN